MALVLRLHDVGIEGAWVKEPKVHVESGKITAYRVQLKVTFQLT